MSCSREALVALLRPWARALRERELCIYEPHREGIEWVYIRAQDPEGILPIVYEALELLTLVGELDIGAWRDLVKEAWAYSQLQQVQWDRPVPFGLPVSSCSDDNITVASYCDRIIFAGVPQRTAHSRGYVAARTKLEELYKEREKVGGITPRAQLQIPVRVAHRHFERKGAEHSVKQLLDVVASQSIRQHDTTTVSVWKPLMEIVRVSVGEHGVFMNAQAFQYMAQIALCGVRLNALSLHRVEFLEEIPLMYITGLQLLLGVKAANGANVGASSVIIPVKIRPRMASAAYSALFKSESVENVRISREKRVVEDHFDSSHDLTWQWIALTFFRKHATCSFDDIYLNVDNLHSGNSSAIEDVLDDPNPLQRICATTHPGVEIVSIEAKYATASKFRLSPPTANNEAVLDYGELVVDIIGRHAQVTSSGTWYCVLLPGWGPAWTKHSDCSLSGVRVADTTVCAPPRLQLGSINARCMLPVVSLLRKVGRYVVKLELHEVTFREAMDEWWLGRVVHHCPQLESLAIDKGGSMNRLSSIARWYEEGNCRIQSIALKGVCLINVSDAAHFFLKLADSNHPMTQHLRHLTIHLNRARLPLPGIEDALHKMLDANKTLQDFTFRVSYQRRLLKREMPQSAQFRRHNGHVLLSRRPTSVPLRNKLALLSAVTANPPQISQPLGRERQSALSQLDTQMLSHIFCFAATCHHRQVNVSFYHGGRPPKPFPEY